MYVLPSNSIQEDCKWWFFVIGSRIDQFRDYDPERVLLFDFLKRRSITYKISRVVKVFLPVPGNYDDLQPLGFIE